MPTGTPIVADPGTKQVAVDRLVGGSPTRMLRLTGTGQVAATVLIVGGLQPNNNSAMVLGAAGAGEFTSETNYSAAAAWDPWSLGVLGLLWAGVRRRTGRSYGR